MRKTAVTRTLSLTAVIALIMALVFITSRLSRLGETTAQLPDPVSERALDKIGRDTLGQALGISATSLELRDAQYRDTSGAVTRKLSDSFREATFLYRLPGSPIKEYYINMNKSDHGDLVVTYHPAK